MTMSYMRGPVDTVQILNTISIIDILFAATDYVQRRF